MVLKLLGCLVVLLAGLMAYVRLAPNDPARFHTDVAPTPKQMDGGVVEVISGTSATLAALNRIALATPRTRLFAGSVEGGHVTYVTRSKLWGFPDFTTVQLQGDQIAIHARLRFGKSDLGVNSARVSDWLDRLQALQD